MNKNVKLSKKYNCVIFTDNRVYDLEKHRFCSIGHLRAGHLQVKLGGKYYYIHRLVAEEFIENKPEGWQDMDVHHLDDNPENNTPENLVFLSHGAHSTLTHKGKKYNKARV